jgi:type 1 glutamine amidotransferase
MESMRHMTRRRALVAGGAAAVAATTPNPLMAAPKQPGETRVLFLVGDYWHNPITQEKNWRSVLRPTGWTLMFAQDTRFVTPDVLAETDLFIEARYSKANNLGWDGGAEIANERMDEEPFLTDEREAAIIENVRRGMGLMAMHCAIWNGERPRFMRLLGIDKPFMHTKIQPALLHKLNPDHPITAGIEPANLGPDEIFMADLTPGASEVLFNLKGEEQPTDRAGGWCRTEGKGRVAVLLPGHNPHPFHSASFKDIMWRTAHWSMGRDIPPREFVNGRPAEDAK